MEDSTFRRPAPAPEFLGPGLLVRVLQCPNLARVISLEILTILSSSDLRLEVSRLTQHRLAFHPNFILGSNYPKPDRCIFCFRSSPFSLRVLRCCDERSQMRTPECLHLRVVKAAIFYGPLRQRLHSRFNSPRNAHLSHPPKRIPIKRKLTCS
ncbi:hypothetical protein K443DRAFT_525266 [Laccaria amethystina LaAM-08-1]|uniref:Uncharacterized protein n=1 Tax=Laccaria amethystina LaAM-08-1 TaxID=1095629 RepID=A0A0C9X2B0_9AGAR|nr:hypothetical protein K443DRAFT_525266 [Laccaria amethystina LaAM-08-1]